MTNKLHKIKKAAALTLAIAVAAGLCTACGTDTETSSPTATQTAAEESVEATEEPDEETFAVGDEEELPEDATPTPELQTAEEAANDTVTIQKELDDVADLIASGDYEDALMQIKSIMTKNLTDADIELIREYYAELKDEVPASMLEGLDILEELDGLED